MKKEESFFGKQLKKYLYEKNFTQNELANKLGINSSMISQWVRGTGNPRLSSIRKIAAALKVPVNYFIDSNSPQDKNEFSSENKNIEVLQLKNEILELKLRVSELEKIVEKLQSKFS